MKRNVIFTIATFVLIGVSISISSGQDRRSKHHRSSISHSKDAKQESYVKVDDNATIVVEKEDGKILRIQVNGVECCKDDFTVIENIEDELLHDMDFSIPNSGLNDLQDLADEEDEERFEEQLAEVQAQRKAHLQAMYEEKTRIINEAIELAQRRKKH
jgi:hypothetical protein